MNFTTVPSALFLRRFFNGRVVFALIAMSFMCCDIAFSQGRSLEGIDFSHDVVPVLRRHCGECHTGDQAKGGFSMNDRGLILRSSAIKVGLSSESDLINRLTDSDPDIRMPPGDRPALSKQEIEVLTQWVDQGLPWESGFRFDRQYYVPSLSLKDPLLSYDATGDRNPIDVILQRGLSSNIELEKQALTDSLFYRRVSLDLVGLLPDASELRDFVVDQNPKKRELLIDQLLANSADYSGHWLSFFNDLFRNDYAGTGFITGGRRQISNWLYQSLMGNKPYDVMASELIAPSSDESRGFIDGIRWRGEVSAGQTVEIQFAQSVAQAFLGINLKCASCHDSFVDQWTLDDAYGLAAIYADRPLELHRCDQPLGRVAKPAWLFTALGQIDPGLDRESRLEQLAKLVTAPENARFSRSIANRLWYRMMGRGIVHPLDAMQSEPWNEELLDYLAGYLIEHKYNLQELLRLIANSDAYQSLSVQVPEDSSAGYSFERPVTRRLTAEQFLDAVWQITGQGPTQFDAPIVQLGQAELDGDSQQFSASWVWGASASNGGVPAAGESLMIRRVIEVQSDLVAAAALVSCDNSFALFLNGVQVGAGDNWSEPTGVSIHPFLRTGENELVVIATNAGTGPNPAGLFFEAYLDYSDGVRERIISDASWAVNGNVPVISNGRLGDFTGSWEPVTLVHALPVWEQALNQKGPFILQRILTNDRFLVRSSLMKNDPLMKTLGRPMREQIVSMRPESLTTLEAMTLSNGEVFAEILSLGARKLALQYSGATKKLVVHLYQSAYARAPNSEELQVAISYVGESAKEEKIVDLLWSIFMSPDFLLVR